MIPVLDVRGLKVAIRTDEGRAEVLDDVGLKLERGRILGVVGESGCGKSTLIRAVMGILPKGAAVEAGEIWFEGENLLVFSERELNTQVRSSRIGFIPQDPLLALNPVFKVGTQLLEAMRWHAAGTRRDHIARLVMLLRRMQVPDPETALERYPHQFSGGQRQRLLIAAALSCAPGLVIADEPTTALDVTTQHQILLLLRELVSEFGVSLLFVTHDFGVVAELCDDLCVIYAGQTVAVRTAGRLPVRTPLRRCAHGLCRGKAGAGQRPVGGPGALRAIHMKPIVEVRDLIVLVGGRRGLLVKPVSPVRAVDGVSFELRQGEILALVGESGSGKTTLGRTLLGLQRETSGEIRLNGATVSGLAPEAARRARRDIHYVHQDAAAALDPAWGRRYPHEFSGGQLRRVALARILLLRPRVLILDEPTSGLDMSVQATVLNLLLELRERFSLTYLFISHDLSVVERLSDRVAIMHLGRIVELGATKPLFAQPSHAYTRALLEAVPRLDGRSLSIGMPVAAK
jgi:ABC-type glutathione transport system ATPase component